MPTPKAARRVTPKQPSTPKNGQGLEPDAAIKSLGIYDASSVKDRIGKWQSLTVSDPPPQESVDSRLGPKAPAIPAKNSGEHSPPVPYTTSPRKPRISQDSPKNATPRPGAEDVQNTTSKPATPKRRLVSDGHWKHAKTPSPEKKSPAKAAPAPDAEVKARPDAWVRPKATHVKENNVSPATKPRSPVKAGGVKTPVASPAPLQSLAKMVSNAETIDPSDNPRPGPPQDQLDAPVVLNAKNLRGLSRGPEDGREVERERRAQYHPALEYFAGKPISDPPPQVQKLLSPPKKPADIRPTLEFFAGRIKPARGRADAGTPNEKDTQDVALSKALASDQPKSRNEPVGRIEAWLGDSSDPFVSKQSQRERKPQRETGVDQIPTREHNTEAEEEHRRRRERRKMAHRHDRTTNQNRANQEEAQDEDLTPKPAEKGQEDSASDSPATNSLKRRGAKRAQHSPRSRVDTQSSPGRARHRAPSPPETLLSGLNTIRPDDSASMMFFEPVPQVPPQNASPTRPSASHASAPKQRAVKSTALVLGSPVPMQSGYVRSGPPVDVEAPGQPLKKSSIKKRKLTSHGDLISVLSENAPASGSLVSACSVKSSRSKPGQASVADLMAELNRDEEKYMRELHTLIDGVIPVLLTSVLAKDNATGPTGFVSSNNTISRATAPIIDMGVALERLRSVHKRMPLENSDAMMFWGPQAHRVYTDYIKTWRLGFEDVIVNLAPATLGDRQAGRGPQLSEGLLGQDSTTNDQGSDSRIDVAYLLKRPLVRVKHLSKTFKGISLAKSSSLAEELSGKYHGLVEAARTRQQEEKGRLEDEAAASIDASRARDPQSLAPLAGVRIDPHKCVRARDFFDLRLLHSSGQRIDCRVELVLRDDIDKRYPGDVLICEVDHASRWLFLPPVKLDSVSARHGDSPAEIVILIRSSQYSPKPWQELVSLHAQDTQTALDWMGMLGTIPVPPSISLPPAPTPAPTPPQRITETGLTPSPLSQALTLPQPTQPDPDPDFNEVHVPFGEQASVLSRRWESPTSSEAGKSSTAGSPTAKASALRSGQPPEGLSQSASSLSVSRSAPRPRSVRPSSFVGNGSVTHVLTPSSDPYRSEHNTDAASETHSAHRARDIADYDRMRRFVNGEQLSEVNSRLRPSHKYAASAESVSDRGRSSWLPWKSGPKRDVVKDVEVDKSPERSAFRPSRPKSESVLFEDDHKAFASHDPMHPVESDRASQIASKPRLSSQKPASPTSGTSSLSNISQKTPQKQQALVSPSKGHQTSPGSTSRELDTRSVDRISNPKPAAVFTPPSPGTPWQRRSSSPLKHEYEPSTASDDSFDGHIETEGEDDTASVSSASSAEDIVPSLPPMDLFNRKHKLPQSVFVPRNPGTVAPSQSASQIPHQVNPESNAGGEKKIASIFCWSDKGAWEPLHPDECSVVVSPGLIEAYAMSASHSGPSKSDPLTEASPYFSPRPEGISPLVGLELTPLVPLRRGTAIDISIRSPPTKESTVKTVSCNIMFRSRNNIECEHLYNAINQARINNPTYIAMQNARPSPESNWAAYMDSRPSERAPWWRRGRMKSSYRAGSSRRTPSVAAQTHESESSIATMTSALSALRRFTGGSKMFNLSKSTVTHGSGPGQSMFSRSSGTSSSGALDSERGRSGASTPPAGVGVGLDGGGGAALGIKGAKIRLYSREAAGRWRDMGSARLTVMQPARPAGAPPPITKDGRLEQEKRVLVEGGGKARVLLDVTLGESAFERVARTGIALSVWERIEEVRNRGGVGGVRVRVYMLQMKSEAEAAYMFSLVGRLRY